MAAYDPLRNRPPMRWESLLPDAFRPGSEAWRWAALLARSLRTALGVGLAVSATGLAALGAALALDGLGFLRLDLPQPESETLAAGLAVIMLSCALLGAAAEGCFRSAGLHPGAAPWETAAAYAPALALTLAVMELMEGWAARLLPRFSELFTLVPSYLDAAGSRGWTAGAAGLALMWSALQFGAPRFPAAAENAPALLYTCWMLSSILTYQPPAL